MDNYASDLLQHYRLAPYWFAYDSKMITELAQLLEDEILRINTIKKNSLWSKDLEELFQ